MNMISPLKSCMIGILLFLPLHLASDGNQYLLNQSPISPNRNISESMYNATGVLRTINGVTVPSDFPEIKILTLKDTAPGKIFFGSTFTDIGNYLVIMENDGTPYFYRKYPNQDRGSGEFRMQSTGILTAYLFQPRFFIAMDHNYVHIDTFQCQNGYATDPHELLLLPNGHAFMIALDYQTVDMSQRIEGGKKNATVIGNHVQELDEDNNVAFEWKSWDYFNITDAIHENLRAYQIDYVHMNSIAVDYDGHLIISSRHLSEVTKINYNTHDIIWRLGGANNQLTFINEPYEISYQHYARPVPGKPNQYTIWDNGNHREHNFSRVVEYYINTENKTAEKVWQYPESPPGPHSYMMGNAQRLPNDNTFINWSTSPPLIATEVTSDHEIVFEMEAAGLSSNRVRRFEWEGMAKQPELIIESGNSGLLLIHNKFGDQNVSHYNIYGELHSNPTTMLASSQASFTVLTDLENNATWYFRVTAVDASGNESDYSNMVQAVTHFIEPGQNSVANGDFSNSKSDWLFQKQNDAQATSQINSLQQYFIEITKGGSALEDIQLKQKNIEVIQGRQYIFEFDAFAENNRLIDAKISRGESPYINYGKIGSSFITRQMQHYAYEFEMTDQTDFTAMIVFNCGGTSEDVILDNVSFKEILISDIKSNTSVPIAFYLNQNYPNPFNESTMISYQLSKNEQITLTVHDILGKRIRVLLDQYQNAGSYQIDFDAKDLVSGLYLIVLKSSSHSQVRKIMLIK
ncbi:aryl-sulfate sulfotransferase [bacterium]